MEFISLLKNNETLPSAIDVPDSLKNKFFYSMVDTDTPRYLENYMEGQLEQPSDEQIIINEKDLLERYLNFSLLESTHKSSDIDLSRAVKELDNLYLISDAGVRKAYIPGYFRARFQHIWPSQDQNIRRQQIEKAVKEGEMHFHIRVRVNMAEIYNLQYLALLLRSQQSLIKTKKISIVLFNTENNLCCFPFCDPNDKIATTKTNETHKAFSRFLRLVAKEATGVIFAPHYDETNEQTRVFSPPNLTPMDFEDVSIGDRFFPLVEITKETYSTLFLDKPFHVITSGYCCI